MKILAFLTILITFGCSDLDDSVSELDEKNESFLTAQGVRADNNYPSDSEIRAILEVANTFSRYALVAELSWSWRASNNLIRHRNGDDAIRGSQDDRVFRTLVSVDDIPYVGKKSFQNLRDYVRDNGWVDKHERVFIETIPNEIVAGRSFGLKGELGKKSVLKIALVAQKGDRLRFWLKKADEVQWNPSIRLYDAKTRLFSANPWGNSDARMPKVTNQYEDGFLVESAGDLRIELKNSSALKGHFEFFLECVSGPCFEHAIGGDSERLDGNFENLSDQKLLDQIAAKHERTHRVFSYHDARDFMFSDLDNFDGHVQCVYTNQVVETEGIPSNDDMNAEHTWPQSKGAKFGAARSDLHHIYPVTSFSNSMRSAFPYCDVEEPFRILGDSVLGFDKEGNKCFEPALGHRGNVARSMFYFSAVYDLRINDREERVLRRWHVEDPVDSNEQERSIRITDYQGSVNDFVQTPSLVARISNF